MANNIKNSISITGTNELIKRYDDLEIAIKANLDEYDDNEGDAIVFALYERTFDVISDLTDLIGSKWVRLYEDIDSSFESGDGERTIHLLSAWAPINPIALQIFRKIHRDDDGLEIRNEWVDEDDPIQRGEYNIIRKAGTDKIIISESFIDLNELSVILDEEIDSYQFDYENDETCEISEGVLLISEEKLISLLEDTITHEEVELIESH